MSLLFNIFHGKLLPLHKCLAVYLFKKTSWVFVIINLLFPVNSSAWEEGRLARAHSKFGTKSFDIT